MKHTYIISPNESHLSQYFSTLDLITYLVCKFFCMQVFDLDLDTERDSTVTLRGLKMENSKLVDSIDKLDPSNMTVVQLKSLEKDVEIVVYLYNNSSLST